MTSNTTQTPDPAVQRVEEVLSSYRQQHPQAEITVKRQNSVSIRIRIVDSNLDALDRTQREERVWPILQRLPDETYADITMLLLLTPAEAKKSLVNLEFDDPIPSAL